jgi:hypothetical protein
MREVRRASATFMSAMVAGKYQRSSGKALTSANQRIFSVSPPLLPPVPLAVAGLTTGTSAAVREIGFCTCYGSPVRNVESRRISPQDRSTAPDPSEHRSIAGNAAPD